MHIKIAQPLYHLGRISQDSQQSSGRERSRPGKMAGVAPSREGVAKGCGVEAIAGRGVTPEKSESCSSGPGPPFRGVSPANKHGTALPCNEQQCVPMRSRQEAPERSTMLHAAIAARRKRSVLAGMQAVRTIAMHAYVDSVSHVREQWAISMATKT